MSNKIKTIRPNLLLAGFQKCGSSSLYHLLVKHPKIVGTRPKETFALTDTGYQHYAAETAWESPGFSWRTFFPDYEEEETTMYFLEGSVCNFYQDKAMDYVRKYPDTKVIFILRDPIQRFLSTYQYYGGSGVHLKPGTTMSEYFEKCKSKQHQHEAMNFALEHGRYVNFINEWENILGNDNILVIGMKLMIKDTSKTLSSIYNFLEIELEYELKLPHKNKTTINRYPRLHRFLVNLFGGYNLLDNAFGEFYKKFVSKEAEREELPELVEQKLKKYYDDEFQVFGHLFLEISKTRFI